MSYQVNWRVFVTDCAYYEMEAISSLTLEVKEAIDKVIQGYIKGKTVSVTSAEVVFLNK